MKEDVEKHGLQLLGISIGFLAGLLLVTIGFFKTLIVLLFTLLGYVISQSWNEDVSIRTVIYRLINKGEN